MKYYQIRTSTTTVNVLGHSGIKKKVKRRTKKYTELLAGKILYLQPLFIMRLIFIF